MGCRKAGLDLTQLDLSSIRQLGAAGSPLPTEGYAWVYEQLGPDVLLNCGSGGTDVCTGIVQGSPMQPVFAGEIAGRCLGSTRPPSARTATRWSESSASS